ncbi:MAG: aminotransferase class I/II-fold pyridoxal phosphate-dependent enzyme [Sedimentisphaerales bacterium]|nr:aminotransferase class I/II-fold pyridoxal phosphate-dependent enzyme [Sedimentisphaerales bacterium]
MRRKIVAERTSLIDASGIRKVFALAATLKDPINFSIGLPDFDVPEPIKDAAIDAIHRGINRYSQTAGDKILLDKITDRVKTETPWQNPGVLVTSGVSGALLLTFMAMIDPGDEVIIPDPYFVIYKHVVRMLGGKCVYVDTYPDFELPVEKIAAAITDKTKLIVLNSPANPTGAVYSRQAVQDMAALAAEKEIVVMSDEIYDLFCYDGPCTSIADYYEHTLLIKGFSKSYAMTGWRMGYAAAGSDPVRQIIEEMTKIQQYTFVCAPAPFQMAAVTAMDLDVQEYIEPYHKKRDMIYEGLKDHYEIAAKPGGAFYLFVKAPDWAANATEFVKKAIENNVLVIPGNVFSEQDTHFRISYTTTDEKIAAGIEVLQKLAKG